MLLNGGNASDASNLYAIGPILLKVAKCCLEIGCTPIIAHHTRTLERDFFDPISLEHLAFAGIKEFSRQWLLLNRRVAYDPGVPGSHRLWMSIGGSAGQSGLWSLDIEEGSLDEQGGGRKWDVTVETATGARMTKVQQREEKRSEQRREKEKAEEADFLTILDRVDQNRSGCGATKIRNLMSISGTVVDRIIERLIDQKIISEVPGFKVAGKVSKGVQRATSGQSGQ
jgi:hypothetical protein